MEEYPIGSRVILKDLSSTEYNGKKGTVQSRRNESGRQQVALQSPSDDKKILGLKPMNLKLEPREVASLSTREMKIILNRCKDFNESLIGLDKNESRELVNDYVKDADEIASVLAKANVKTDTATAAAAATTTAKTTATGSGLKQQMQQQADQLNQLSPEQLRQQAHMMRSMDPNVVRRMNPAMANFTDAQIQMAAMQMEQMANNPQMMQDMVNQMKNMSNEQLEQMKGSMPGVGGVGSVPSPSASSAVASNGTDNPLTTENINNGIQNMASIPPEQLRQQANMMKSMSKDTIKSMNPMMASWPDQQIDMAIQQMEMMSNNPELSKQMMDQMKRMKPEDIERIQKMSGGGTGTNATGTGSTMPDMSMDPMQMMQNMDPAQIKQMIQMVSDNPAMFKEMIRSTNPAMADQMTDEQISKTMDTFANLDERKIGWLLKLMNLVQKVRGAVKGKCVFILALVIGLIGVWVARRSGSGVGHDDIEISDVMDEAGSDYHDIPVMMEEDEF